MTQFIISRTAPLFKFPSSERLITDVYTRHNDRFLWTSGELNPRRPLGTKTDYVSEPKYRLHCTPARNTMLWTTTTTMISCLYCEHLH